MKKTNLLLACFLALLSCSKAKPVKYYWGQTESHYKNIIYRADPLLYESELWDSTYNDGVMVEIDESRNKIRFILSNVKDKGRFGQSEFEFDYTEEGRYILSIGNHISQAFLLRGDSLHSSLYEYIGQGGPSYTNKRSDFAGKRSY